MGRAAAVSVNAAPSHDGQSRALQFGVFTLTAWEAALLQGPRWWSNDGTAVRLTASLGNHSHLGCSQYSKSTGLQPPEEEGFLGCCHVLLLWGKDVMA